MSLDFPNTANLSGLSSITNVPLTKVFEIHTQGYGQ
jgi:hypothetical protein